MRLFHSELRNEFKVNLETQEQEFLENLGHEGCVHEHAHEHQNPIGDHEQAHEELDVKSDRKHHSLIV